MLRPKLIALAAMIWPAALIASQSSQWITIAATDDMVWEGQAGSLGASENNKREAVYKAAGRTRNLKTNEITFEQWYVRVSDCQRGAGRLVTTDINGNFRYDNDFVLQGGSVASSLADMLCSAELNDRGQGLSL